MALGDDISFRLCEFEFSQNGMETLRDVVSSGEGEPVVPRKNGARVGATNRISSPHDTWQHSCYVAMSYGDV